MKGPGPMEISLSQSLPIVCSLHLPKPRLVHHVCRSDDPMRLYLKNNQNQRQSTLSQTYKKDSTLPWGITGGVIRRHSLASFYIPLCQVAGISLHPKSAVLTRGPPRGRRRCGCQFWKLLILKLQGLQTESRSTLVRPPRVCSFPSGVGQGINNGVLTATCCCREPSRRLRAS